MSRHKPPGSRGRSCTGSLLWPWAVGIMVHARAAGHRLQCPSETSNNKGRTMTEKTTKPKTKRKSIAGQQRKSAKSAPKVAKSAGGDWREQTLTRMRALILAADPEMIEERKWKKPSNGMAGVPVWSHEGIVCTGETYKNVVKLTFAHGASVADPSRLFNSSLEGNMRRAIDIHEGEKV